MTGLAGRARGRGAVALIGFLLLFAGVVGGIVLWVLAEREPGRAADAFARAAPGCVTTLSFSDTGEYYVFEELSGVTVSADGCEPTATPGQPFEFMLVGPDGEQVPAVTDTSISYDLDAGSATSVARIRIDEPGSYEISVFGEDPAVVAAIGGDPTADVPRLRRGAVAAAGIGLVLGGALLWIASRRSRRAVEAPMPTDPGWGVTERDRLRRAGVDVDGDEVWPPRPPSISQVPVNPHQPDEVRVAGAPSPPAPSVGSPWAPPTDDEPDPELPPPADSPVAEE